MDYPPSIYNASYVLGSHRSLLDLSVEERRALDTFPVVIACNLFVKHWKLLDIRPTHWVLGDTDREEVVGLLRECLYAIVSSAALRQRLRTIYLGLELRPRDVAAVVRETGVSRTKINIVYYTRGHWSDFHQPIARSLDEPIYHYASTLTDLVNFAALVNPGQAIRILGCPYTEMYQHFYDAQPVDQLPDFLKRLWSGLSLMALRGLPLIDCNARHEYCPGIMPRARLLAEHTDMPDWPATMTPENILEGA